MERILKPGFSLYLDLFRFLLAITVVVFHAIIQQMGGNWLNFPYGVDAVIGFFVLSGLVIAYVTETKETCATSYTAARLARLWSVLLPALVLTPVFDSVGRRFSPLVYEGWGIWVAFDHPLLRLGMAATFLNEIWFWSVALLSNGPVWSLGFEAWYYAIFGVFIFLKGRARLLSGFVALMAGPKILLLFPIWLMGVFLYRWGSRIRIPRPLGFVLFVTGPAAIIALTNSRLPSLLDYLTSRALGPDFTAFSLKYAREFVFDNLVGFLFAAHLAGAFSVADKIGEVLAPVEGLIRRAAGYTLSIYLLHFPAGLMISATLHRLPDGPTKTMCVVCGSITMAVLVGSFAERQRFWMKAAFEKCLFQVRLTLTGV